MIKVNGVLQPGWPWNRLRLNDQLFVSHVHASRRELILKARKQFPGATAQDLKDGTLIICQDIPSKRPYARRTAEQKAIEKRKAERRQWHRDQPAVDPFS